MTPTNEHAERADRRRWIALGVSVAAGAAGSAIALIDSIPGWDSTGITAGLLFVSAGVAAAIGRDRPWLWALLVGLPTPLFETAQTGQLGSWLALIFAATGAATGWAFARAAR
ncbi:MAG: hypothetical protein ABJC39_03865 [Chloroflexota bacterium]